METKELILKQFPGTAMIPMVTAGSCIGLARRTCYNLAHNNRFPLPIRKIGSKSMVALVDLINFLDNKEPKPVAKMEQPRRRPGRPTKAEQVRRMRELNQVSLRDSPL